MVEIDSDLGEYPKICQACSARIHGVCGALRAPDLIELSKHTSQRKVKKGDIIVFDDDTVKDYVNIVSGTVKLSKILNDGRQQIVGLQFAPEFVGRPFASFSRITAEAATDGEVCVLRRKSIETKIIETQSFERRLFDQTLVQLDEAREWMVTLGRKTASEKLASFLLLLVNHIGTDPEDSRRGKNIELPLTRGEIADFLGLTIETVSRHLTKFRKQGVIEMLTNNYINVPNMHRLEDITGN